MPRTVRPARLLFAVLGAVALGALTAAEAHADTVARPPNVSEPGDSGLRLSITQQVARVSPSLAANGAGRVAWLSAHVTVNAPHLIAKAADPNNGPLGESTLPGSNGTAWTGGAATFSVGYIIGCQVGVGSLSIGGSTTLSASAEALTGSLSVPLTPGAVNYVLIDYKNLSKSGDYVIDYRDFQVNIEGCGGYAQARAYAVVETGGADHQKIEAYGQPFSVG